MCLDLYKQGQASNSGQGPLWWWLVRWVGWIFTTCHSHYQLPFGGRIPHLVSSLRTFALETDPHSAHTHTHTHTQHAHSHNTHPQHTHTHNTHAHSTLTRTTHSQHTHKTAAVSFVSQLLLLYSTPANPRRQHADGFNGDQRGSQRGFVTSPTEIQPPQSTNCDWDTGTSSPSRYPCQHASPLDAGAQKNVETSNISCYTFLSLVCLSPSSSPSLATPPQLVY